MTDPGAVRVLVVEDDAAFSEVLCEELREQGRVPTPTASIAAALDLLSRKDFEVALLDLMLPDGRGIDVLRRIAAEDLPTEAIVLTGYAELSTAIEAMKLGAYDYLTKPARLEELNVLVAKAAEKALLRRENVSLRTQLRTQGTLEGLVTQDPAMKLLIDTLERAAASQLPVLIQGESGTGKELFARAVHRKSPRAEQPFVAINCAAVSESLVESELFGHERGSFTGAVERKVGLFEVANRGVLFLDEVGDLTPSVQAKLLRAVEVKEFMRVGGTRTLRSDVRLVAATNKDLKEEVHAGRFREDLFYRLNGISLPVPPLRARRDDIPLLALHFAGKLGGKELTPRALQALKSYPWPGNVRELQMVVQRAAILSRKGTIDAEDLGIDRNESWNRSALKSRLTLEQLEREYIKTVLDEEGGHRGRAAKTLGIDPKTLYNKLGPDRPRNPS